MKKVISFDLDGTLVDARYGAMVWNHGIPAEYAKAYGMTFDDARRFIRNQYESVGDGDILWYEIRHWLKRFSLDVEPMGPVHAQIALVGARAAVTLWAERPDSAARLRDATALLSDGLRAAELEPGDVLVRGGAPPRSRESSASAGRFLDRAS